MLLCSLLPAQEQNQKNDGGKPYLTIITHADWSKRPDEKELVESISSQPTLGVAKQCHFNHYTTSSDMYKHRWASIYPEDSLPVIVFQNPQGGYWYKASNQNIPRGSQNLYDEIVRYTNKTPVDHRPQPQATDSEDRPRILPRRPKDDDNPDSSDMWAGGNAPIRETLSNGMMIMLGVVFLAGLLAVAVVGVGFIVAINKAFSK